MSGYCKDCGNTLCICKDIATSEKKAAEIVHENEERLKKRIIMKVNKCENIVLVDVDQTIISRLEGRTTHKYEFFANYYGNQVKVCPIDEHIELLKSYKARGYYIRVHSNNGWQWAEEIVNKLGLQEYVDSVETKPCKWVDDSENVNEVIGQRVFIK